MAIINERKIKTAENGIISAEAIRAYLENKLSDEERNEVEQLIATDPFTADALDGIRNTENTTDAFLAIEKISNHLCERSGISKKTANELTNTIQVDGRVFVYAAVVITIIVAIGAIIWFISSKLNEKPVVVATEKVTVPEQTIAVDSATVISDTLKKDSVAVPITQQTTPTPVLPAKTTSVPAASQTTDSATSTADAMTLFNNGNYIDAEKKFDDIFKKSPSNTEAQYFSAVSAYINGNTSKAEKQFDNMLNSGLYVDGSKWYKACILLKKGDTSTATEMLRSLSISSGIYKERAIKKLETLNQ